MISLNKTALATGPSCRPGSLPVSSFLSLPWDGTAPIGPGGFLSLCGRIDELTYYFLNALVRQGHSEGSEENSEALLNIRVLCGAGIYHLPQARHSTGAKGCVGVFSRTCRLNCCEWLTNHFPGQVVGGHTCTRTSTPSTHAEIPVFSFLDKKLEHQTMVLENMAD